MSDLSNAMSNVDTEINDELVSEYAPKSARQPEHKPAPQPEPKPAQHWTPTPTHSGVETWGLYLKDEGEKLRALEASQQAKVAKAIEVRNADRARVSTRIEHLRMAISGKEDEMDKINDAAKELEAAHEKAMKEWADELSEQRQAYEAFKRTYEQLKDNATGRTSVGQGG